MSQFLLPCSCGAQIPVNRSQAGMSLPCLQCGKSIDVPTIRNLAPYANTLPAKKETTGNNSWKWLGPIAAIAFLVGLVGLAIGGNMAYERYYIISQVTSNGMDLTKTEEDYLSEVRKVALKSAPADTWDYWNVMVSEGLSDPSPPEFFRIKRYLESRFQPMMAWLITGAAGTAIFAVTSVLMQKLRPKK